MEEKTDSNETIIVEDGKMDSPAHYSLQDLLEGVAEIPVKTVLPFLATTIEERILKGIGCDDLVGKSMFLHEQVRSRARIFQALEKTDFLPLQVTVTLSQYPKFQALRLYETTDQQKCIRVYHFGYDRTKKQQIETVDLISLKKFFDDEITKLNDMTFATFLAILVKCQKDKYNNFVISNKENRKIFFCSFFSVQNVNKLHIYRILDFPPETNIETALHTPWLPVQYPYYVLDLNPIIEYDINTTELDLIKSDPLVKEELDKEEYKEEKESK